MSKCELRLDVSVAGVLALHPGVTNDVGHRQALMGVKLEHACNEVLELVREEPWFVALTVHFPEQVSPVGGQQFVERVAGRSLGEGRVLRVQNEENHSEGEDVHNMALVGLAIQNFGSHVRSCTDQRAAVTIFLAALNLDCKTEVNDLGVEFFVEQDVLGLEVAVADAVGVQVVQTHQNLFEIEPADAGAEGTGIGYEVKKFAA